MASTQVLKRRIRSIGNTKQITKAMELVAATKMRKVQEAARHARIYSDAAISVLRRLSTSVDTNYHPFYNPPPSKTKLHIIFSSDRGLAGAYNSNIFYAAAAAFQEDAKAGLKSKVIVYGRKGARHFARGLNIELLSEYENIADIPNANVFAPVIETIIRGVDEAVFGAIDMIYTESRTSLTQRVRTLPLVPIRRDDETAADEKPPEIVYEFEPDVGVVLDSAIKLYLESSLRRARIDAAASEHAMRMLSMNNANRNAGDLIDSLTLELNATRQAAITQEMAEIIGGSEAVTA